MLCNPLLCTMIVLVLIQMHIAVLRVHYLSTFPTPDKMPNPILILILILFPLPILILLTFL